MPICRSNTGFKSHSVVKIGETPLGATCAPAAAVCNFFAATAFLATPLPFFLAAFLSADFIFRVRMAFFCIELRFEGMGFLSRRIYIISR